MTLDEARALGVGAAVVYNPYLGALIEQGVITRISSTWVYVRYDGEAWPQATDPEHLSPRRTS